MGAPSCTQPPHFWNPEAAHLLTLSKRNTSHKPGMETLGTLQMASQEGEEAQAREPGRSRCGCPAWLGICPNKTQDLGTDKPMLKFK